MDSADIPAGLTGAHGWIDGREVLVLSYRHAPAVPLDRLTPAEREILEAVLAGRKNAEIARARGRSERTVHKQVATAMRKVGVRSRGELAAAMTRPVGH
jgi:DNA-binding NarL/FixJ family response regulator